jgi:hypothetical protein
MRRIVPLGLVLAGLCLAGAGDGGGFDHDHTRLASLLGRYLKDGRVDYASLKKDGAADLAAILETAATAGPAGWSREQHLAFYLNAYNACVLHEVVRRYPIARVIDDGAFFKNPVCRVAGETLSLDRLEKEVILPRFKEPRVHFALVCAARGCPPLQATPWLAKGIDERLEQATRAYLTSPFGLAVDAAGKRVRASRLFEWYAADFGGAGFGVRAFLAERRPADAALIQDAGTRLEFLEYDWALNKQ